MANMFINAMTDLWNSAGTTYSAIKMNVTNSASSATSKLIHMQVGGVDKFTVDKSGNLYAAGILTGTGNSNPSANDAAALGELGTAWSDLFLASGGFINLGASDVTITHSSNALAFAGATSGYSFDAAVVPATDDAAALGTTALGWSDAFYATGGTIHFGNTNWVATHTSGILTVGTGDLRVTTAGTNAASVVTVGGTQTLTSKTLTSPTITSGALNGTIGATTPSTGAFTTLTTSSTITASGTILGTETVAAKNSSGNVHLWLYGPANEDRCAIYTAATSAGHAYLRVNGTATYTFQNDGTFLVPGHISAGGIITAASHIYSGGGGFIGSSGDAVVATTGAAAVYLRPNGIGDGTGQLYVDSLGRVYNTYGFGCKAGSAGGTGGNVFNLYWTGAAMQLWVDGSSLGNISTTSDYRIKKDVAELDSKWDTVKALRPISYTQKEFQPAGASAPLFTNDDEVRWGFVAHELQEALIPDAATGVKDAPDTIQSPNPWTVIAVLTKALQEAMARIEALEG